MLKRSKKKIAKIASLILSAALFIPAMYGMTVKDFVRADDTVAKTTSNTKLGVNQISNPRIPESEDDKWNGSYVYFGKYEDIPVKYRVLDKNSTLFSEKQTVFLDCDSTLFDADFDSSSNVWINSDIRDTLNGTAFLEKDGVFTSVEKSSIVASTVAGHPLTSVNSEAIFKFVNYIGLQNDKIFLLDAEDVLNPEYGYYDAIANGTYSSSAPYHPAYNWYKCELQSPSYFNIWWLRSQDHELDYQAVDLFAGGIFYGIGGLQVNGTSAGVAPAMNIDSDRILFSTAVKGTYGALGTEYKLTLLDPEMIVSVPDNSASMDWGKVTFDYTLSGQRFAERSQISYIVTSKTLGSDGNSILDYGATHGGNNKGYFTLSNTVSGTWGEDYHIYVFAEKINGACETDYAGIPVELVNPESQIGFGNKTISNTKLGVDGIHNPAIPATPSSSWDGSIVYFGKYGGNPIRFRVLDKDCTAFGDDTTLFLDSEGALFSHEFSNNGSNAWVGSDIRNVLNGSGFLDKSGVFTILEKAAIYSSNTQTHALTGRQDVIDLLGHAVGLENDRIFLLDVEELLNEKYGYIFDDSPIYECHSNAAKWAYFKDAMAVWALRNAEAGANTTSAFVTRTGSLGTIGISYMSPRDIAPALNVNHDSILFSTAIKGKYGELGTEYKLTLLDPEMIVSVPDKSASMDGGKVTFSYTLSGQRFAERSQISYIVTSKTLGSDGNSILDYGAIHGGNNKGYFTLSNSVSGTWGEDYHIYVFAEKINGACETDYAGIPVEITAPVPRPKIVSHAIRLSGSIGVKFGVDFPDGTDVSKCYVGFVTSTGRKTTVRTSSAGETDSSRYYIFSINCLEMADEITATLYYDGEAIQTDKYSAMSYIEYLQNHTQDFDSRIIDLVNALHTYGYYMQQSNWSDSVNHTAIPKPSEILTSLDVDRAVTKLNMDTFCDIRKNMGTSGISSDVMVSLTLTSVTTLKIYVKPENSSVIMPRNSTSVNLNGEKYYVFSVSNIGPNHLDTQRRFEIRTNQGTATISLPALFYVKTMLNYGLTTQAQKLALTAYYRYYEAAKALVG